MQHFVGLAQSSSGLDEPSCERASKSGAVAAAFPSCDNTRCIYLGRPPAPSWKAGSGGAAFPPRGCAMSASGSQLPPPLWAYREPPGGLDTEWQRNYVVLADPVTRVATFRPDDARRGSRESFAAWADTLQRSMAAAEAVLQFLHGRSQRTWKAGRAILAAITPTSAMLTSAARFLANPTPTRAGPEATADSFRTD